MIVGVVELLVDAFPAEQARQPCTGLVARVHHGIFSSGVDRHGGQGGRVAGEMPDEVHRARPQG